jgi:hypothetical protein
MSNVATGVVTRAWTATLAVALAAACDDEEPIPLDDGENGLLVEVSRDFFAQAPGGTVCYFGEDVDDYEDGEIVELVSVEPVPPVTN